MRRKQIIVTLLLIVFTFILTVVPTAAKTTSEEAIYAAKTRVMVSMRKSIGSTRRVGDPIARNTNIRVYEYNNGWCKVKYDGKTGWIDEQYLWAFRSLNPETIPVPHQHTNTGLLTLNSDLNLRADDFGERLYAKGDSFCIHTTDSYDESVAYVWRSIVPIDIADHDYLPFTPWAEANAGDIIGGFSTFYTEDQGAPYQENRVLNLELACKRLDGVIIQPHKKFSFNKFCAPYTRTNGYEVAPSVGGSGKGPGGGVCQVSTTLFNAILNLPIDIKEWSLHSQDGAPYIPLSFDAATGPRQDLVFESRLDYPVQIHAEAKNGVVTILLVCEKEINDDN